MIARRRLLFSALGAAVVLRVARAQQTKNFARIGFLSTIPLASITPRTEAFRQGLRSLGYVEGQNISIEWRAADEIWDRLPALAAQLVNMKPDVYRRWRVVSPR